MPAAKKTPDGDQTSYEVKVANVTFLVKSAGTPREVKTEVMKKLRTIGKTASPIGVSVR